MPIEDQARTVLNLLLDPTGQPRPHTTDFRLCPNCDTPTQSLATPYCSEVCRDQSAFIRQFRAALASQSILDPEKQTVFGERLWWHLGGGLPIREARIPESAKRQVVKRSEGKCEFCGAPMATIQNHGSGCNRPFHLRAVCTNCSKTKLYNDLEFTQTAPVVKLLTEFSQRINATHPIRLCDDHEAWDWRAFLAQRRLQS